MKKFDTRLEVKLPADRRRELDQLSEQAGVSPAALARLAIARLIEERLRLPADRQAAA